MRHPAECDSSYPVELNSVWAYLNDHVNNSSWNYRLTIWSYSERSLSNKILGQGHSTFIMFSFCEIDRSTEVSILNSKRTVQTVKTGRSFLMTFDLKFHSLWWFVMNESLIQKAESKRALESKFKTTKNHRKWAFVSSLNNKKLEINFEYYTFIIRKLRGSLIRF